MRCADCRFWITARQTTYGDGSIVNNYIAPEGKGACEKLSTETAPDFGCVHFVAGDVHILTTHKAGAPWQHSHAGPCPDCSGKGSGEGGTGCYRCAGTGKVRHYDDGYIGEERTRLHPKEKELTKPLTCSQCQKVVEVEWVACPHCGHKLEPVAATEVISGVLGAA